MGYELLDFKAREEGIDTVDLGFGELSVGNTVLQELSDYRYFGNVRNSVRGKMGVYTFVHEPLADEEEEYMLGKRFDHG